MARDSVRRLDQHHADIYVMLQMQQRLIVALQEAVFYGISDDWIDRTITLIVDAKVRADIMNITDRSGNENQSHRTRDTVRVDRAD